MTVSTTARQQSRRNIDLTFRWRDTPGLDLQQMTMWLTELTCVIDVFTEDTFASKGRNYEMHSVPYLQRLSAATEVIVKQVSYNSPFEVVLTFPQTLALGMTSASATAFAILRFWNRLQEARVIKLQADIEVELRRHLLAAIRDMEPSQLDKLDSPFFRDILSQASTGLSRLEAIEEGPTSA